MENDHQLETNEEASKTHINSDIHGEHQLEQPQEEGKQKDQSEIEGAHEDSKEDKEDSRTEISTEAIASASKEAPTTSALSKKEERLRRLRELHLRRVSLLCDILYQTHVSLFLE